MEGREELTDFCRDRLTGRLIKKYNPDNNIKAFIPTVLRYFNPFSLFSEGFQSFFIHVQFSQPLDLLLLFPWPLLPTQTLNHSPLDISKPSKEVRMPQQKLPINSYERTQKILLVLDESDQVS